MYPQGVCRIRKPAYAGNGCAIFLVFQTEEVGQKDGCGSQTQLRGVALGIFRFVFLVRRCPICVILHIYHHAVAQYHIEKYGKHTADCT